MNKYKEADTSFLINSRSSLRPIRIALPKPPPLKMIDGYGKNPEDQKFEKIDIPSRLQRLEAIAVEEAEKEAAKRSTVLS
ncbi:MAG: hypothetical protein ACTSU6_03395, partial [Candidatus Njordarchaeales archaeon]